ncbi:MAG: EI24 domain-containing protein, partial [Acidobacteria bacterium]|nr:EI24 domain-containing protein [Acidobacteriota bacterium]
MLVLKFWTFWQAAAKAKREIDGLRQLVAKALIVNTLIILFLILLASWLLYAYLLAPINLWLVQEAPNWLAILGRVLLWLVYATLLILISFFSLRTSVAFMEFWYEIIVARIVNHFRPVHDFPLTFKGLGMMSLTAIRELIWSLFLSVMLVVTGFIPLVGGVLVFVLGGYFLGRSLHAPYRTVMKEQKLAYELPNPTWLFNLKYGAIHLALPMVPVIGWVLSPIS